MDLARVRRIFVTSVAEVHGSDEADQRHAVKVFVSRPNPTHRLSDDDADMEGQEDDAACYARHLLKSEDVLRPGSNTHWFRKLQNRPATVSGLRLFFVCAVVGRLILRIGKKNGISFFSGFDGGWVRPGVW